MPEATLIDQLLRTRLLVAALGERVQEPWWRTQFLTTTGLRVGQRIFPRRFGAAALSTATAAACRDHDVHTGRRSFHLFRLPGQIENQLVKAANQLVNWEIPDQLHEPHVDLGLKPTP